MLLLLKDRPCESLVALYIFCSLATALIPLTIIDLQHLLFLLPAEPYRPWTWFSYALVERDPLLLPVVIPFLLLTLRYFARVWSSRSLLLFIAFCVPAAAISWLLVMLLCVLLPLPSFLHAPTHMSEISPVRGTAGLFASIIMAFRHTIPEHRLDCYFFAFRVKFLPFTVFMGSLVLAILRIISRSQFSFFAIALLVAWVYIRYLRFQDGLRGDRSDAFSFTSLFPDQVKPLVRPLANCIHYVLVSLRVVRPSPPPLDMELGFAALSARNQLQQQQIPSSVNVYSSNKFGSIPSDPTTATTTTTSDTTTTIVNDAERRKALALKAVEDRLKLKSQLQQQQQLQQQPTSAADHDPHVAEIENTATDALLPPQPPPSAKRPPTSRNNASKLD